MTWDIHPEVVDGIAAARTLATEGDLAAARTAFRDLLDSLCDDPRQSAGVLHMYAVVEEDLPEKLALNIEALRVAEEVPLDELAEAQRATLYAGIGFSHLALGDAAAATPWYQRAEEAAVGLDDDEYGNMMRSNIAKALAKCMGE